MEKDSPWRSALNTLLGGGIGSVQGASQQLPVAHAWLEPDQHTGETADYHAIIRT